MTNFYGMKAPTTFELSDDRNIDTLIEKHRESIDRLKDSVSDVDMTKPHGLVYDDIFFLRYILSNKTVKKAVPKVRTTINYRNENGDQLDAIVLPHKYDIVFKYMKYVAHKFTKSGDILFICRSVVNDEDKLQELIEPNDMFLYMKSTNELMYRLLDRFTRETRRLTKMSIVMDYTGRSPKMGTKQQAMTKAQGRNSKFSEVHFPQMQGKTVVLNLPRFVVAFWNVAKKFFSKSMVEKIVIVRADTTRLFETCKEVSELIDVKDLPTFWGGQCNCENGCITGISNAVRGAMIEADADGVRNIALLRRQKISVSENVIVGMTVEYKVNVEAFNIPITVELIPEGCSSEDSILIQDTTVIESAGGEISGKWSIDITGTLIITIDNSASLLRGKNVKLTIDVSDIDEKRSGMCVDDVDVDMNKTELAEPIA